VLAKNHQMFAPAHSIQGLWYDPKTSVFDGMTNLPLSLRAFEYMAEQARAGNG
jgi:hypothetical protein